MKSSNMKNTLLTLLLFTQLLSYSQEAVPVGSGSYASYPPDAVLDNDGFYARPYRDVRDDWPYYIHPDRQSDPIPTNEWWSNALFSEYTGDLWSYPGKVNGTASGVTVAAVTRFNAYDARTVAAETDSYLWISGNTSQGTFSVDNALAYQWTDLSFTFRSEDENGNRMDATLVHGVPFTYVDMVGISPQVSFSSTPDAYYDGEGNTVTTFPATVNTLVCDIDGVLFGIHAPEGSTFDWSGGSIAITNPAGNPEYVVVSEIPTVALIDDYDAVSRNKITNTFFSWETDPGKIQTTFTFETENYETGSTGGSTIFSLIPHQWRDTELSSSFLPDAEYTSIKGQMKSVETSALTITYPFTGMPPYMPSPQNLSDSQLQTLESLISNRAGQSAGFNGSTYAKGLGEEANMMLMARELEHPDFTTFRDNLKKELIDWFTFSPEEADQSSYYFSRYPQYGAYIGWPTGFGSQAFNDLHFHYGYFVMGAARLMLVDEEFKEEYGDMARLIAQNYANHKRYGVNDTARLPFLRNFDPYFGHSFAGGTGDNGGNNQESTSEALHSWFAIYTLGVALNDPELIDLGVTGFKLESLATDFYWLDKYNDLPEEYNFEYVGILRTNAVSMATYFDGDPAWAFGIQFVPCDFFYQYYLSDDAVKNAEMYESMIQDRIDFNEFTSTDILENVTEMGSYLGGYNLNFIKTYDPQFVVDAYDHLLENGDASWSYDVNSPTNYYIANNLLTYGAPANDYYLSELTGNVFMDEETGEVSYIVYNPTDEIMEVHVYENGDIIDTITVGPHQLYNSKDQTGGIPQVQFAGIANDDLLIEDEKVVIETYASDTDGIVESVELYINGSLYETSDSKPFEFTYTPTGSGTVEMYLKAVDNMGNEGLSETITVNIIENNQSPYNGTPFSIPTDIIPAVEWDNGGALIAYYDSDENNHGAGVRQDESIDTEGGEGLNGNIGWCAAGEWMEYTITVESSGMYDMNLQYSSAYGGGKYSISVDGENLSGTQAITQTESWADYTTHTITGLTLLAGEHVLRLNIESAGLNLRSMQFEKVSDLNAITIDLKEGWNLVSLNVEPENSLIGTVFPNATIVKTFDAFYSSTQPEFLNTLTEIEGGVGYLVYNSMDETITISGVETHGSASLQDGWNLIGVPSSDPIPVTDFLEAKIIKDFTLYYESGESLNSLSELEPGKAYFLYK